MWTLTAVSSQVKPIDCINKVKNSQWFSVQSAVRNLHPLDVFAKQTGLNINKTQLMYIDKHSQQTFKSMVSHFSFLAKIIKAKLSARTVCFPTTSWIWSDSANNQRSIVKSRLWMLAGNQSWCEKKVWWIPEKSSAQLYHQLRIMGKKLKARTLSLK